MKYQGPISFKVLYENLTKASFKKFGFINSRLISEWKDIVGVNIASICMPDRISFEPHKTNDGVLHLIISNPAFSLEVQSLENKIIERIATYFGYKAVAKIRILVRAGKRKFLADWKENATNQENTDLVLDLPEEIESLRDEDLKKLFSSLYQNIK